MGVVAFITDLFFQAKVAEIAKQVGVNLKITTSLYRFIPELEQGPSLILIDLNSEGIDGQALIAQIKGSHPDLPIVAYASHVNEIAISHARAAGADHVLPRSRFSRELPALLRQAKGDD